MERKAYGSMSNKETQSVDISSKLMILDEEKKLNGDSLVYYTN